MNLDLLRSVTDRLKDATAGLLEIAAQGATDAFALGQERGQALQDEVRAAVEPRPSPKREETPRG